MLFVELRVEMVGEPWLLNMTGKEYENVKTQRELHKI